MAENEKKRNQKKPREEQSFEREVSEGRELIERAGKKAGEKLGKEAEDRLRKFRGR